MEFTFSRVRDAAYLDGKSDPTGPGGGGAIPFFLLFKNLLRSKIVVREMAIVGQSERAWFNTLLDDITGGEEDRLHCNAPFFL